jgi:hypothetical protein
VFVSGSSVRSIWVRNNLENFKKRLEALEEKVANDGIILNDAQVAALEKKKHDDVCVQKEYRKIRNDHTFSYGNKFYLIESPLKHSIAKQKIEIRKLVNTTLLLISQGVIYPYQK